MSDTKNNLAALAADVESALARRRSRSAAAISWVREAALAHAAKHAAGPTTPKDAA